MSPGNRKRKKVETGAESSTVAGLNSSAETAGKISLPPGTGKLRSDRTLLTTKEDFITAPAESCFRILANQLEWSSKWDPVIVDARPVSSVRGRIGATSQVTLNLGGRELVSPAVICRYQSNRAMSWVLSNEPKVREDWVLQPKGNGTLVRVSLAQEVPGGIIGRWLCKVTSWKKVELDLEITLKLLKALAEVSH